MGATELGKLIRAARLRKGWQQDDLGQRLGVDRSYVSAIEGGKRNWPQTYIKRLSEVLGLDEIEMARAAGLISPDGGISEAPVYDATSVAIARAVAGWTPRQKSLLWSYIEAVAAALDATDPPIEDDASATGD